MNKIPEIGFLFSGSASSVQYLEKHDPNYGRTYKVICGVSTKQNTKGEYFCRANGIPFKEFNAKKFCLDHEYDGPIRDMPSDIRYHYFTNMMLFFKKYYIVDFLICSGFMLKISKPLLGSIPIINVHPADLRIYDDVTEKPKYIGDDAVTMALEAGEAYTKSTIHVVEEKVDCGKIICMSKELEVVQGVLPKDHQELMKTMCDGPAYMEALRMITSCEFVF